MNVESVRNYKCPVCGSDIQISDTTLSNSEDSIDRAFRFRIETAIKHVQPIIEAECAELFIELAKEQKEIITRTVLRASENLPQG